jgi:hypothetical protein
MKLDFPTELNMTLVIVTITAFNVGVLCHSFMPDLWSMLPPSSRHDPIHKKMYSDTCDFQKVIDEAIALIESQTEN